MPDVAPSGPSLRKFAGALSTGLLWGVGVAALIGGGIMTFVTLADGSTARAWPYILEATIWTAMVATFLALFPIGPIAGLLGWQLYRRGIVARWAHAAVGAVAAVVAPLLIVFILNDTSRYPTTNVAVVHDGFALAAVAAFPVIGAFAGFMAAGVLQRGSRT